MRLLRRTNPPLLAGVAMLVALLAAAFAAPWLTPFDPLMPLLLPDPATGGNLRPPYPPGTAGMLLGSDNLRRDLLTRLLFGARYTLLLCAISALLRIFIGGLLGLLAGWFSRLARPLDILISAWSAIPPLFFCLIPLALISRLRSTELTTLAFILLIGVSGWAEIAVRVRSATSALRSASFVESAYAIGRTPNGVLWHHIVPNLRGLLLIELAYAITAVLLLNAELSFLGVFIAGAESELPPGGASTGLVRPDPRYAEWGSMLAKGVETRQRAPWTLLAPIAAFAYTILAFNLLADGLRRHAHR